MRQVSIEFSVRHLQVAAQRTLAAATSPLVARMNRNGMDPGADLAGGVVGGFVGTSTSVFLHPRQPIQPAHLVPLLPRRSPDRDVRVVHVRVVVPVQ